MKTRILNLLLPTILLPFAILAQEQTRPAQAVALEHFLEQQEAPKLTTFDLKFPGGTPQELVAAIEKAMGKPVNVIIPSEHHSVPLPEFEVHGVTLPQLLFAIGGVSRSGLSGYQYTFETTGKTTDTSIWTFNVIGGSKVARAPERFRRLYQLAPYLEVFKVEDITTAIETAWGMKSVGPGQPEMKFHKDTQLLIVLGTDEELGLIEQVLSQLEERLRKPAIFIDPQTGLPTSPEKITN